MEELWKLVFDNLAKMGIGMIIFVAAYLCNMCFSLWYNIKICNQDFDKSRVISSIIKIIVFGVGTALLCISITTIPQFCNYVGLTIPEEYSEVFQNLAIITVFVVSGCKYVKEAYLKFIAILDSKSVQSAG